ncbi:MAG: TonB-dependent receptor domain-containing protein [Myxococcota bacterium]
MTSFAPIAAVLVVTLALPAQGDNTADEADLAFRLGNQAYARRDYPRALSAYFLSHRLVPNRNVLFNIARCYEALLRFDEAYRYYHDLQALPLAPDDKREVAAALARLRPKVALLTVTSEPAGADVYIDREDLGSRGRTPQTLAVPAGKHLVLTKLEGFHPAERTVQVARGKETAQRFALRRVVGRVSFAGSPEGAVIRDAPEGLELGRVPATFEVPPGKRLFYVTAPHYLPAQFLVEVTADTPLSLRVALVPKPMPTGKVIVTANRENALVRVDGQEAGFTPTVLLLPEGEHQVEISARELTPFTRTVQVLRDEERRLHAELRYAPPPVTAASKSLLSVDEAPASITVISAEEIRAFGYQTLAEVLAAVRGFFAGNDRIYSYLGVRGFSPPGDLNTRVLFLWDGHPMNDVWAGQGFAGRDFSVDLSEVERIEVVRGPGSALYGTGAFFAVINVVPRDHLGASTVEATGAVGALSAYRGRLTTALGGEKRSALASVAYFRAGGAELTDLGERGRALGLDGERSFSASLRARYQGLTLQAYLNDRSKDIPTAPYATGLNLPGTRVNDARGFAEVRYEKKLGDSNVSLRTYYDGSRYQGSWYFDPPTLDEPPELQTDAGRADWVGGEARARFRLFSKNFLTVGVESQWQLRVEQEVFGGPDAPPLEGRARTLLSAYLLDEWQPHPRASLSAGLRLDKYLDLAELPLTPRLALILRPYERGLTKLVAGSAFRAPNVYELYYGDNNVSQRPALTLSPETITTLEVEHSHDLNPELRLSVAGYHNRIENLVVLTAEEELLCGDPVGTAGCNVNTNAPGLVRAFGAEAELRWRPGRFALVDVAYSFVNLLADPEVVPDTSPAHLISARLMLPLGDTGAHLATQATYQSARGGGQMLGEALLLNVGISGEAGRLRYLATVSNALDSRYVLPVGDESLSIPQYGRTFLLELSASY